jgi:hypothetical protein
MKELLPRGQKRIEIDAPGKQQQAGLRIKRSLADLPMPAKEMNVVSVVCAYTLMGLSERDIATALNISVDRVERVKMLDAYSTVYDFVTKAIIDEEADDVRHLFAANAKKAAKNMVELADSSENDGVRLKANQDILDRAGHRPVDVVQIHGQLDSTLKVVYVEEEPVGDIIDGEAVQIEEG